MRPWHHWGSFSGDPQNFKPEIFRRPLKIGGAATMCALQYKGETSRHMLTSALKQPVSQKKPTTFAGAILF